MAPLLHRAAIKSNVMSQNSWLRGETCFRYGYTLRHDVGLFLVVCRVIGVIKGVGLTKRVACIANFKPGAHNEALAKYVHGDLTNINSQQVSK